MRACLNADSQNWHKIRKGTYAHMAFPSVRYSYKTDNLSNPYADASHYTCRTGVRSAPSSHMLTLVVGRAHTPSAAEQHRPLW